jgi:hypothetical protein
MRKKSMSTIGKTTRFDKLMAFCSLCTPILAFLIGIFTLDLFSRGGRETQIMLQLMPLLPVAGLILGVASRRSFAGRAGILINLMLLAFMMLYWQELWQGWKQYWPN